MFLNSDVNSVSLFIFLQEDADMDESPVSPTPTDNKEWITEQQTPETNAHTPKKKRKSALADLLGETFKTTHHRLSATSIAETEFKQYLLQVT